MVLVAAALAWFSMGLGFGMLLMRLTSRKKPLTVAQAFRRLHLGAKFPAHPDSCCALACLNRNGVEVSEIRQDGMVWLGIKEVSSPGPEAPYKSMGFKA